MINTYKYGKYFKENINNGDVIEFVKENDDAVKLEILDKKLSEFKITYRGRSMLNNFALQDFYTDNCIDILVNEKSILKEVS